MHDTKQLDAEIAEAETEIQGLLTQTATLKVERERLNQVEIEAREAVEALTAQIDAFEQPRLHELKMRKSKLCQARMALRNLNKTALVSMVLGVLATFGCAGTQHVLEEANAKLEQAKSIVAEADAKRQQLCAEALDALQTVEAAAPFACGLVEVSVGAPSVATKACAQRDKLTAAVHNVTLACELGK